VSKPLSKSQPDLFPALPEGFAYREDAVSAAEEKQFLAAIPALPFKPFEFHGHLANRRVVSYGFRYDYGGRRLRESEAVPDFLVPLREKAAAMARLPAKTFVQVLVSEYAPGAGIGWHKDRPQFDQVIGVSLLAPCLFRLRRKAGAKWERKSFTAQPRSAYLLSGASRHGWEHSIPPLKELRYSVTFRSFR
jgi:alkylated DNA repair dioxygenase AlkB